MIWVLSAIDFYFAFNQNGYFTIRILLQYYESLNANLRKTRSFTRVSK